MGELRQQRARQLEPRPGPRVIDRQQVRDGTQSRRVQQGKWTGAGREVCTRGLRHGTTRGMGRLHFNGALKGNAAHFKNSHNVISIQLMFVNLQHSFLVLEIRDRTLEVVLSPECKIMGGQ